MRKIRVTWTEETTYQQTFEVDDDFEPLGEEYAEDEPLIELIVEDADYCAQRPETSQVSINVMERDVQNWEWTA